MGWKRKGFILGLEVAFVESQVRLYFAWQDKNMHWFMAVFPYILQELILEHVSGITMVSVRIPFIFAAQFWETVFQIMDTVCFNY